MSRSVNKKFLNGIQEVVGSIPIGSTSFINSLCDILAKIACIRDTNGTALGGNLAGPGESASRLCDIWPPPVGQGAGLRFHDSADQTAGQLWVPPQPSARRGFRPPDLQIGMGPKTCQQSAPGARLPVFSLLKQRGGSRAGLDFLRCPF